MKSFLTPICLLFSFSILIFIGCKKDKAEKPQQVQLPDLETKSVAAYPDGGISLQGQINQVPANLNEYGFLVSADSTFRIYYFTYKATKAATTGTFNVDVNTGLEKGKTYYYTAYSLTSTGGIKQYNSKSFIAGEGKHVKIASITPLKADIGDTITVKGKYLGSRNVIIRFGTKYTNIYTQNDSTIKFMVPESIDQIAPLIAFEYDGITDTITNKFSLNKPVITNFTTTGTFRDTIVINGDHFNRITATNEVYLGNTKVQGARGNKKQLRIAVPDDMETVTNTLTVKAQLQSVTATGNFSVRLPEITYVTPSGYANAVDGTGRLRDIITIKGKYFHPLAYKNQVSFEGNSTPVLDGSTTELHTNIPQGPYPRKKAKIKIKFLDREITYPYDATLKDTWIMIAGSFPFAVSTSGGAFSINNSSFVIASKNELDIGHKALWKLNPSDYSWQQLNIPFPLTYSTVAATATKAYVYTADKTNNFWEYDSAANTWTQKADYPGKLRYSSTMFAIGSNVFIGLGTSAGGPEPGYNNPNTTFYKYDTNTDTWKRVADYPTGGARSHSTALVLNGLAYVGGGASYTPDADLECYNPTNNTWKKLNDFNAPYWGCYAFVVNNTGYTSNGLSTNFNYSTYRSVYKYNIAGDSWTMLPETVGAAFLGPPGLDNGFTIVNNGYVFIGGSSGSVNPQLFVAKATDL